MTIRRSWALLIATLLCVGCGSSGNKTTSDKGTSTKDSGGPDPDQGIQLDSEPGFDFMVFSDTGKPVKDTGVPFDTMAPPPDNQVIFPDVGPSPDTMPNPTCAQVVGMPCTEMGGECGASATCLLVSATGGVCTCACSPDDPATAYNEDTCEDLTNNICGVIELSDGSLQGLCMQKCQPKLGGNDCQAPFVCSPYSTAYSNSSTQAVCLFEGCTANTDCPVILDKPCDTTTGGCATNEQCLPYISTGTAGLCAEAGTCDTASGLCGGHATNVATAKIGDTCSSDKDCGAYMSCSREFDAAATLGQSDHGQSCYDDDECCGQCDPYSYTCQGLCTVHARNGYCISSGCAVATATAYQQFACAAGSACNRLYYGGVCMKTCALGTASDCRGNAADKLGDYECRAWNLVDVGTGPFADAPICDFGDNISCAIFNGSTLDCSSLGGAGNPTNMSCRGLDDVAKSDVYDITGFCLDDTASGPIQ